MSSLLASLAHKKRNRNENVQLQIQKKVIIVRLHMSQLHTGMFVQMS